MALMYLAISIAVLRKILWTPGAVGLRHDWPIPSDPELVGPWEWPYTWSSHSLGFESHHILPFLDPLLYVQLGLSGEAVTKALLVLLLTLSGVAMYGLCRVVGLKEAPSFVGGLFYSLTPVVFNKIVAGHVFYLMSYACSPLLLGCFAVSVHEGRIDRRSLALAALFFTLACAHAIFLPMLLFLLVAYCLFAGDLRRILGRAKALALLLAAFTAVNAARRRARALA
ncbi:TPA: hypothetical protein EYP44_02690, partial [Candidatus Bathyarchaeota archaeon]|nr:hypothetical protein [Candidatus Bathyarchaeota archaeon]